MRCYAASATPTRKGLAVGAKTLWFLNTSLKQAPQMSKFLPGRNPPELAPNIWRTTGARGRPADGLIGITAEQAIQRGILVAGNPDTVVTGRSWRSTTRSTGSRI